MTSLKTVPRIGFRFVAIAAFATCCCAATEGFATDLRGRIEMKSRSRVTIEVRSTKPPHAPLRTTVSDLEGRYYIADIPPGRYVLVVNGSMFPISVEQVAIQELAPIAIAS